MNNKNYVKTGIENLYENDNGHSKETISNMFNNIAGHYDFLNHFLSFGLDKCWRKAAIKKLGNVRDKNIIDIATGTADIAINLCRYAPRRITAIDISKEMMKQAEIKINKKNLSGFIELTEADSESTPFAESSFDAAIMGFGIRNFENPLKGLKEIYRILKPGAKIVILEFSLPQNFPGKILGRFYINKIVPVFGKNISQNNHAYSYLPDSIKVFPAGKEFIKLMANAGFDELSVKKMTFGVVSVYSGVKINK